MKRFTHLFFLLVLLRLCIPEAAAQQVVRASGAVSVAMPLAEAAGILRSERNIELILRAGGGTGMGLDALGEKTVNMALCSRELTAVDRAEYPAMQMNEIPIGVQIVALTVSRDVWLGGVHSLTASQIRGIYEGKITNWQQVGGPNTRIKVFMNEPGRGPWEVLVQWLYKEIKKAPVWRGAKVKEIQETRNMLEFTPGSLALMPPAFADNRSIFPLALQEDDSTTPVEPTLESILQQRYPLSRPLVLVIDDRPTGALKVVIEFMTGERGQAIVKQFGYVTVAELRAAKEKQ